MLSHFAFVTFRLSAADLLLVFLPCASFSLPELEAFPQHCACEQMSSCNSCIEAVESIKCQLSCCAGLALVRVLVLSSSGSANEDEAAAACRTDPERRDGEFTSDFQGCPFELPDSESALLLLGRTCTRARL